MGPPVGEEIAQQMQAPGPIGQAALRGGQPQQQPQDPMAAPGGDDSGIIGQSMVVKNHLQDMIQKEPALAPWLNNAINQVETGVRTVMSQRQQQSGGTYPEASANAAPGPAAGLPM